MADVVNPPGMRFERVKMSSLKHYPDNANEGDVGAIAESLREHGQYMPILVQESTRYILKGNTTFEGADVEEWDEIDVIFVDVDDEEALRINIGDNWYGRLGRFDEELLGRQLLTLQQQTAKGLLGTGVDDDDLHDLLTRVHTPLSLPGARAGDPQSGHRQHQCPECNHQWEGSCTPRDDPA